jgi:hypothetical protein
MSHYDVDLWVDTFELDTDGILRVRLTGAKKRASIGEVVCIGDGELVSFACVEEIEGSPSTGVALLKLLTGPDGGPSAPMLTDDGWCDVLDE